MIGTLLREELRFLAFRPVGPALVEHRGPFLAFGLACTWLAGVGRYWDNPRASTFQHLGLGSLVYAFVLAAILWLIVKPLKPRSWTYANVLLFVTLTSPPAILYAIPVERFLALDVAARVNVWFLAVVACWRVALLFAFLRRTAGLRIFEVAVAALLPLTAIVAVLALLNLEHVVFDIMAGLSETRKSPNDQTYVFVLRLAEVASYAGPVLLLAYFACIARRNLGAGSRPNP
jgi:hypothetical protein